MRDVLESREYCNYLHELLKAKVNVQWYDNCDTELCDVHKRVSETVAKMRQAIPVATAVLQKYRIHLFLIKVRYLVWLILLAIGILLSWGIELVLLSLFTVLIVYYFIIEQFGPPYDKGPFAYYSPMLSSSDELNSLIYLNNDFEQDFWRDEVYDNVKGCDTIRIVDFSEAVLRPYKDFDSDSYSIKPMTIKTISSSDYLLSVEKKREFDSLNSRELYDF